MVAVATLLLASRSGWPGPIEAVDECQDRLDVAAPVPTAALTLQQSFVAQHDGLTAIELLLVVHESPGRDESAGPHEAEVPVLTLSLLDRAGSRLHTQSWDALALVHNQPLRFAFSPLARSAGREYRLRLEGTAANRATAWAYSLDGYQRGELAVELPPGQSSAGQARPLDLRFQTFYRYSLPAALRDLSQSTAGQLGLFGALSLLLFLPGLALFPSRSIPSRDLGVGFGVALAGSLICLPLGWLWLTQVGGRWNGLTLWLALGAAALLVGLRWRRRRPSLRLHPETAVLLLILLLGLSVRMLAIRDLVMPPWVDSPQHVLISRMMADSGMVPVGYRPWMPVDLFWYHFGFHALAASLHQMTGFALPQILLVGGQLLNALAPLSVYAGAVLLTGRRRAGLLAAFFVALLSLFPAYYLSWGRYTQLSGMLILPPLLGLSFRFFGSADRLAFVVLGRRAIRLGFLLGGLFLVHARVWIYALIWLPVAVIGVWTAGPSGPGSRSPARAPEHWRSAISTLLGWLGVVVGVMAACAIPWLVRVGEQRLLPMLPDLGQRGSLGGYNDIPWGYLTYGWERGWLVAGAIGLIWALFRRKRPVALLGAWIAAVFVIINSDKLGLPAVWLVNNNTWFISLFVPVGMILGWMVDDWLRLAGRHPAAKLLTHGCLTAAVVWSGLFGVRQMIDMVSPETVLFRPDDMPVIEWAEANLPADALVAVNAWTWLGEANWAGSDGGYWLLPLTGLQTTMPPIGYGLTAENRQLVNDFNRQLAEVDDWSAPDSLALLQSRGVTHVLIGARGGPLRPESLMASRSFRLLFSNGAAWLFEVD